MQIITRDTTTRLSRQKHIFIRDNPQLKELFFKLKKYDIRGIDDIKPPLPKGKYESGWICEYCGLIFKDMQNYEDHIKLCEIKNNIMNAMIEHEVEWTFHNDIIPYLTFSNHTPYIGEFDKAIPKIIKELMKL